MNEHLARPLLAIHQPNLFPRLSVLAKLAAADGVYILDDVQYVRREWQNRFYIRGLRDLSPVLCTLPIQSKGNRNTAISEIRVDNYSHWRSSFLRAIHNYYGKSAFWQDVMSLYSVLPSSCEYLAQASIPVLSFLIQRCTVSAIEVNSNPITDTDRNGRLVSICKQLRYESYLCGSGGAKYISEEAFSSRGVSVFYFKWRAPNDTLPWKDISTLDFVARYGFSGLADYLKDVRNDRSSFR